MWYNKKSGDNMSKKYTIITAIILLIVLLIILNFNKFLFVTELVTVFLLLIYNKKNSIDENKSKNSNIKIRDIQIKEKNNISNIELKSLNNEKISNNKEKEIKREEDNKKTNNENNKKKQIIYSENRQNNNKRIEEKVEKRKENFNNLAEKVEKRKENFNNLVEKAEKKEVKNNINNIKNLKVTNNINKIEPEKIKIKDNINKENIRKTNELTKNIEEKKEFTNEENIFCAMISKIIFDNNDKVNKLYYRKTDKENINLESTNINFKVKDNKKFFIIPKRKIKKEQQILSKDPKITVPINTKEDIKKVSNFIISESKNIKENNKKENYNIFNREKTIRILEKKKKKEKKRKVNLLANIYLRLANMYHKSQAYDKEIRILKRGINNLSNQNIDTNIFLKKIELAKKEKEKKEKEKQKKKILLRESK